MSFFNEAHESGSSGEQSNLLEASSETPDDPSVDEFKLALKAGLGSMLSFLDDQGEPIFISTSSLVIAVPPAMLIAATEAVSATVVEDQPNALKGIARVVALPWLVDQSKWYLLKTDGVVRPFIFQDREPVEFKAMAEDSDEGFRREKFLFGVRARYRMAYGY